MKITIIRSLPICVMLIGLLTSTGCGGPGEPPEITPQVAEEIQQQDSAIADEEGGL